MARVCKINLLSRKLFLMTLLIWCLLNSTVPLKCNPYAQYVALIFALWAFIILFYEVNYKTYKLLFFPNSVLFIFFIIIAIISSIRAFITEEASGTVQNVYALIAIIINVFMVYNNRFDQKSYIQFLKIGYYTSLVIVILSHLSLLLHLNIEVPNAEGKIFTIGIERGEGRFTGLLGNPNDLGRMALFGLLCLLLYWSVSKVKHKISWSISLLLFWFCITMSASRGVIYSLYLSALAAGIISTMVKNRGEDCSTLGKFGVLFTVVVIWFSIIVASEMATKTYSHFVNIIEETFITVIDKTEEHGNGAPNEVVMIEERADTGKGFSTGRSFLIKLGVSTTWDYSFVTGLTPGNSKRLCMDYMNQKWNLNHAPSAAIGNTHNMWIQAFVNYGIAAFLVLLVVTISIISKLIQWSLFSKYERTQKYEKTVILVVLFSLMILGMVENVFLYSFENEPVNLLFMLVMGRVMLFEKTHDRIPEKYSSLQSGIRNRNES